MPLDTLSYNSNGDGTFNKTVTHVEVVSDVQEEILALQGQLSAFKAGELNATIRAAIANYEEQLTVLGA